MSQENEEHLTPFQLARRAYMNNNNNNNNTINNSHPNQRSRTTSNTPSRPNQTSQPPNTNVSSQESEENLTPFQIAQRKFRSNSNTLPPGHPTSVKPPPPNQQQQGTQNTTAQSPIQQLQDNPKPTTLSQNNQAGNKPINTKEIQQNQEPPKQISPTPSKTQNLEQNSVQQQTNVQKQILSQQRPNIPGQPSPQPNALLQQTPNQPTQISTKQNAIPTPGIPSQQRPNIPGQPSSQQRPNIPGQPSSQPNALSQQTSNHPTQVPSQQNTISSPGNQSQQRPNIPGQPSSQPNALSQQTSNHPTQVPSQQNTISSPGNQSQQRPNIPGQPSTHQTPNSPGKPSVQENTNLQAESEQSQQYSNIPSQVIARQHSSPSLTNSTQSVDLGQSPIMKDDIHSSVNLNSNPYSIDSSRYHTTSPYSPETKQKNKTGLFKKKKSLSPQPSTFQFDDAYQSDSYLTPPQLIRVGSVIQVVSVPSTASSSKEYLQVPNIRSVLASDLYQIRKIRLETYPTTYRFFSLTSNELSSLPWLNYLIDRPTDNFIFPGEFSQMQPTEMQCHCELDFKDYEPDNDPVISPKNYISEFESPSSAEFKSNPFIDLNAKSVISSIVFPFVREESRIGFLHLKSLSLSQSSTERFGMELKIYAFVYTDKAITETFYVKMSKDFSISEGFISSMNAPNGTESIIIPYPLNQPAYLVLSLILEDPTVEESPGSPFAYGKFLLPKNKLPEKIQFDFVAGMTNEPLVNILGAPANIPMKFNAEAELVEAPVAGSTLRLTAFSNMMPTPVFSIYDIAIQMNLKISSSKDKVCFSLKLRKILADNKSQEPREVCGFLDFKTGRMVDLAYSGLRDYNEKIIFHEPINFILDSSIADPVEVVLTTYTLKKKKLNPIMVSKFQIKNSQQRHVNKMEVKGSLIADMKSAFSKQDNMLSCSTLFPAIICPGHILRDAFSMPIKEPILSDPMFKDMGLYLIQKFLNKQNIPRVSFYELFDCIRMSNMGEIQNWIDHFFTPEKGFTHEYIKRLVDSFDIIKDWPQPFFSIAFKGFCSENDIRDIDVLFNSIVNCKVDTIKKSTGDLLLQIPMFFDIKVAHKIAFKFINQLNTADRFYIFKYIFSDILYVESLTCMDFQIAGKKPHNPYVPLLSLFYSTITNAFIENNADSVGAVSFTLSILATTLELYLDPENSRHVAKILFPLISIIFTFYDSLSVKLEKKNSLLPILLFIMKYSDKDQFMQYYQLLSSDNKPRFFEFLTILFDNSMINSSQGADPQQPQQDPNTSVDVNKALKMTDVARNTFYFNDHPLNCVYEITCRLMIFLSHFESDINCDEQIKLAIITLLLHMLSPQIQPAESYGILYKTLSNFIKIFADSVFIKETGLINQLFTSIIPLTQRKILTVRMQSIGFILWLMEKERMYRQNMSRCDLAVQYAICNSVFDLNQLICYPFWKFLPSTGTDIQVLYESLIGSINAALVEKKISKLLELYGKYQNFPSIRGRIYLKIIEINLQAGNLFSAFITQWKFCGFIAEVFKLQKVVVPGIPTEGYKVFPFIANDLPVDLSKFPPDSAYLVTKSDLFTPESIEKALIKALEIAMKANLYWLIGDITQYLFDYLEYKRKYSILYDLYTQVSLSYQVMQKDEKPKMEFARVFVKGKSVEKLGFAEAIHACAMGGLPNYVQSLFTLLEGVGNVVFDVEPKFDSKKENDCQIVQVYPVLSEIYKLNAKTFTLDVDQDYKDWNDIMIKRYTFITETPLPSSIPTVKVEKSSIKEITMKDYFIEKLKQYHDELQRLTYSINQVLPPPKMLQQWKSYVNGLTATPIISMMNKVFVLNKKSPYYNIVYQLKEHDPSFAITPLTPLLQSAPEEIKILCDDVWQLLVDSVPVTNTLINLSSTDKEKAQFVSFRRRLGVPLVDLV